MNNIISTTSKEWTINGELTKEEYKQLVHLIRRFNYRDFSVRFQNRKAGKEAAYFYRSASGNPYTFCYTLAEAASTYIKCCVYLYRNAQTSDEREEQIANAKEWVEKYGYGSRI